MSRSSFIDSRIAVVFAFLLAALTSAGAAAADPSPWTQVSEHWYIFELAGGRAGWVRTEVQSDGKQYRTINETSIRVGRMDEQASIHLQSAFTETHAGTPVSLSLTTNMSSQTVETRAVFTDEGIEHTVTESGRSTTKLLPKPEGEWLAPQAVDRFLRERHEARAKEITFRMVEPQSGLQPITVISAYVRDDTYTFDGREIPVTVWTSRTSIVPIDSTEMYSSDGVLTYTETQTGMGKIIMRLASKAAALAPLGAEIPELIVSSFVEADRPIPGAMNAAQARYRLRAKQGELPELPTTGAQRVAGNENGSMTLIVDIDDNVAAPETDTAEREYIERSSLIDSEDPLVKKLTERALRGKDEQDAMARAAALRAFAYKHISKKGMSTAFASASETAKTRAGDCSEHAVLLAALLRAANIPSRVATGLVFMTNKDNKAMFGWHMWTQALIDGRWVDFDATLPVRHNAGHITTGTSSFSDTASAADLASLFLLMGNLDIEILEVKSDSATSAETVPAE